MPPSHAAAEAAFLADSYPPAIDNSDPQWDLLPLLFPRFHDHVKEKLSTAAPQFARLACKGFIIARREIYAESAHAASLIRQNRMPTFSLTAPSPVGGVQPAADHASDYGSAHEEEHDDSAAPAAAEPAPPSAPRTGASAAPDASVTIIVSPPHLAEIDEEGMNVILGWITDEARRKRYRTRCNNSGRELLALFQAERYRWLNSTGQGAIEAIIGRLERSGPFEMSVRAFNMFAGEFEGWNNAQLPAQHMSNSRICAKYVHMVKQNLSSDEKTNLELDIRDNNCRDKLEELKDVIQSRLSDAASESIADSSQRGRFLSFRGGKGGRGGDRGGRGRGSDPHRPNNPPDKPCQHCRAAGKGDKFHWHADCYLKKAKDAEKAAAAKSPAGTGTAAVLAAVTPDSTETTVVGAVKMLASAAADDAPPIAVYASLFEGPPGVPVTIDVSEAPSGHMRVLSAVCDDCDETQSFVTESETDLDRCAPPSPPPSPPPIPPSHATFIRELPVEPAPHVPHAEDPGVPLKPIDALIHLSTVIASDSITALAEAISSVRLSEVTRDPNSVIALYISDHPGIAWRTDAPTCTPCVSNCLRLLSETFPFSWTDPHLVDETLLLLHHLCNTPLRAEHAHSSQPGIAPTRLAAMTVQCTKAAAGSPSHSAEDLMADAVSRELACQTALAKTPVKPTTSGLERKWRDANTLSGAYGVGILPTHAELACPVAAKTPSVTAASPTVRDHDARLCAVSALSLDTKLAHMRDVLAEHGLSDRAFCREADLPYVSPGVGYSGRTKRDMLNDARRAVGLRELVSALPIAHTARGDNGYNAELASAAAVGIPAPDFDIAVTTATPIVTAPMTAPAATSTVVAPAGCTVVTPSTTSTVIAPADATVFAPAAAAVRPTPNRWSTCALVTATSAVNIALLLVAVMFAAPAYEPGESTASSTRPLPVETCLVALAVAFVALCASIAMSASAKLAYRLACLCLQANTGSGGSRDRATSLGGLPPWTFSSLAARRRSDAASRVSSCLQPTALPRLPWCLAAYFVAVYLDVGLTILRCRDDDVASTTFAGTKGSKR